MGLLLQMTPFALHIVIWAIFYYKNTDESNFKPFNLNLTVKALQLT